VEFVRGLKPGRTPSDAGAHRRTNHSATNPESGSPSGSPRILRRLPIVKIGRLGITKGWGQVLEERRRVGGQVLNYEVSCGRVEPAMICRGCLATKSSNSKPVPDDFDTPYPVFSTQYPVPSNQYSIPSTRYAVLGTQYSVRSTHSPLTSVSPSVVPAASCPRSTATRCCWPSRCVRASRVRFRVRVARACAGRLVGSGPSHV
jgi:hypothetical protein